MRAASIHAHLYVPLLHSACRKRAIGRCIHDLQGNKKKSWSNHYWTFVQTISTFSSRIIILISLSLYIYIFSFNISRFLLIYTINHIKTAVCYTPLVWLYKILICPVIVNLLRIRTFWNVRTHAHFDRITINVHLTCTISIIWQQLTQVSEN